MDPNKPINTKAELIKALSTPEELIHEGVGKFEELAKALMNNFQIKKGDNRYWMTEIEFYLYHDEHRDIITYPRRCKAGMWFFHASGVDITFESKFPKESPEELKQKPFLDKGVVFGGVLIRGIQTVDDDKRRVKGPINVCDELFDMFDAFGEPVAFPQLVAAEPDKRNVEPDRAKRVGMIKDYSKKVHGILSGNYREYNKSVFHEPDLVAQFKEFWEKGLYRFSAWS